jgi:hypothetical protein
MFPDSSASAGKKEGEVQQTADQVAFSQLMRGIHF